MTREHKLALIIGFSLILLVGVLISDHLSGARQAQVGEFGPGDVQIAEVVPNPPLAYPGLDPEPPPGWTDPRLYQPTSPEVVPPLPSPIGTMTAEAGGSVNDRIMDAGPVVIANGPTLSRASEMDARLVRAVEEFGGRVVERSGIAEIEVPAAASTRPASTQRPAAMREAARPAPAIPENFEWHTVQRGESLYQIAAKVYGNGNDWREIARANSDRIDESGAVRAGVRIRIPVREGAATRQNPVPAPGPAPTRTQPIRTAERNAATPSSTRTSAATPATPGRTVQVSQQGAGARTPHREVVTYTVRPGDTLGTISQRMLGTSRRWREIADLNKIENVDRVPVGRVLKIPANNQG